MSLNVLVISDGIVHPPLMGRKALKRSLETNAGFQFSYSRSIETLCRKEMMEYDGLVLYFHHQRISEACLGAFDDFVTLGGGVLAIHSVTASFKDSDRFTEILGGKFIGHGRVEPFELLPVSPKSEPFKDIPKLAVSDELYLHKTTPDIEIHFYTHYQGQTVPCVWTRRHGSGRVCYAVPGHRATSMRQPTYQEILVRGLTWVCEPKSGLREGKA